MAGETEFDSDNTVQNNKIKTKWWKWLILLLLLFMVSLLIYISYIYKLFNYMTTSKISPANEPKNILRAEKLSGEDSGDINVLFLGMRGEEEIEPNITNAMMIMNLDTKTKKINFLSLPRDLWIPVKDYGDSKSNSIYKIANQKYGNNNKKKLEFTKEVFAEFTGMDIHYVFLIDFLGFEEMINDIGPIDISMTKEEADSYPFLKDENFKKILVSESYVTYRLNGEQSLIFIRWPKNAIPDFDRIKRQHLFLCSLRDQYLNYNVLLNPVKVIRMMKSSSKSVKMDFNLREILKFIKMTEGFDLADINKHYLHTTADEYGGLLMESKNDAGVIYIPRAGKNNFSEIQNWTKEIVNK